ncbi:MAG: sugar transporter substrate-binding protein [Paenibacillaceae bacterium]|jgi:putative aldouronate transport system substrate-binding protein|nr:sugar transporter substrate-binding protein [Paenibacillaceae bacterium]
MKKSKHIYALLALVLTAALAMAGCTDSNQSSESSSPSASSSPQLTPVELSIFYPGDEQKDTALVEAELNKLLKDKINATVKINAVSWGDWTQKINLMVSGGEPFDLMFSASWDRFGSNVAKGAFLPLNDLIGTYGKELKASMRDEYFSATSMDGKIYAVPVQKELAQQFGLVLSKPLVEKYKFDLSKIKKLADLEPWLQTIKDNEPDVVPLWASRTLSGLLPFETVGSSSIPGSIYKGGEAKIINKFETPEMTEMLALIRSWNLKGYFQNDPATQKDATAHNKAGRVFAQQMQLKPGKDVEFSVQQGQEFVQLELTDAHTTSGDITGALTAISRTSKNPERAMMLLNLLHTDAEVLNTLVFGIEGTHYIRNGNIISKPANLAEKSYTPGINWMFGNQFLNYLWDNEDPKKWDKFREFNNSAKPSVLLGFNYNPEPVTNEEAAIINIFDQYIDALFTGVGEPAALVAEFNEKMRKAGMNKILEEKQKQVNEFLKR